MATTVLNRPNRLGGRYLGTLNSSNVSRSFAAPAPSDADVDGPAVNTYTPRPMARPQMRTAVAPAYRPGANVRGVLSNIGAARLNSQGQAVGSTGGLVPMQASDDEALAAAKLADQSTGFLQTNTNAGTLPQSAPRPPQQTERANPLSGDTSEQMEGTTSVISRSPYSMRTRTPAGRDLSYNGPVFGRAPTMAMSPYDRYARSLFS